MKPASQPCHVVHLLYRFAAGGLENVLVQLVNGLPREDFRHTIIALTEVDSAFASRIQRSDVEIISLHKTPGQPFRLYPRMYRLLRQLRPDVVHSCNLAALEFMPVAALVGVPRRIHAEHGWDVADPEGRNWRYRLLRKIYKYFVQDFVAVSTQLADYLLQAIDVSDKHVHVIPNGVDTVLFSPRSANDPLPSGFPFKRDEHCVIGTVGRLEPIKNQGLLVDAFIHLMSMGLPGIDKLRLAIVGTGPLATELQHKMRAASLEDRLWLPGARNDIPQLLRCFDCFVLPSLAEGTSCTLQEAMATACKLVVTDVGGNADLLEDGALGALVPSQDVEALAQAIYRATCDADAQVMTKRALLAREHIESHYALPHVLTRYAVLFSAS